MADHIHGFEVTGLPLDPKQTYRDGSGATFINGEFVPAEVFSQYVLACKEAARKLTFGADYKKDGRGRPVEQGIGSPGNVNIQHIEAQIKSIEREIAHEKSFGAEPSATLLKQRAEAVARRDAFRQRAADMD